MARNFPDGGREIRHIYSHGSSPSIGFRYSAYPSDVRAYDALPWWTKLRYVFSLRGLNCGGCYSWLKATGRVKDA